MSEHNPNAFPVSTIDGFTDHGMTLRDWFAGQALCGAIGVAIPAKGSKMEVEDQIAAAMYLMADAMLAARALTNSEGGGDDA